MYALSILANLSLREMLRPQILAAQGIDVFTAIVKKADELFESVEA